MIRDEIRFNCYFPFGKFACSGSSDGNKKSPPRFDKFLMSESHMMLEFYVRVIVIHLLYLYSSTLKIYYEPLPPSHASDPSDDCINGSHLPYVLK